MRKLKPSGLPFVLHTLPILMLLHADYVIVLIEACYREPSLLHVPKGQLIQLVQAKYYSNVLFSMEQHVCSLGLITYFEKHFDSTLKDTVSAFKAARYFSPVRMNNIQPNADALNSLKAFPFLNSQVVLEGLKGELSSYLAMVSDIDADIEILRWWQ